MKKFLTKIAVFIFVLSLFLVAFQAFLTYPRESLMTVPPGTTTVFMGNSTVEISINDSLIPRSYNFAKSAETLGVVYAKLVHLKRYNPCIDTVILSFDDAIITSEAYVPPASAKVVLMDAYSPGDWLRDIDYYAVKNSKPFVSLLYNYNYIQPIWEENKRGLSHIRNYIGGFRPSHRRNLENEIAEYIEGEDVVGIDNSVFPAINRYYLDKIVSFCKENDITLIFLSTPKYRYFWDYHAYREIHDRYYPEIPLIDCMTMEFPDSCYVDIAHLNYIGADIFSMKMKEILKRK